MSHVATITIDHTKVGADLTDFVVYVNLADLPAGFWSTVANGGGDIRVYKSDGTTELAREVVRCDTATDTGELHIKYSGTLSSSVDTVIQIHADGTSSEPAVTATYGRNAVWSAYSGVYHLDDDPTGTIINSTGGTQASSVGSMTSGDEVAGQIGNGIDLDGTNDAVVYGTNVHNLDNTYTVSGWIKTTDASWVMLYDSRKNAVPYNGIGVGLYEGDPYFITRDSSNVQSVAQGNTAISDGNWQHVVGVFSAKNSATGASLYANGSEVTYATRQTTPSGTIDPSNTEKMGTLQQGQLAWAAATFDEVRIIDSILSAEWVSTEYNNQSSASTFYTASAVGGGYAGDIKSYAGVLQANIKSYAGITNANIKSWGGVSNV